MDYFNYCRSLDFEEKPKYNFIRCLFKRVFKRFQFKFDYVFDWNIKKDKVKFFNKKSKVYTNLKIKGRRI